MTDPIGNQKPRMSRGIKTALWSVGGVVFALIVVFQGALVYRLYHKPPVFPHPDPKPGNASVTIPPVNRRTLNQGGFAGAESVSIMLGSTIEERGIQFVPKSDGVTTPDVAAGIDCHKMMDRKDAYAYFSVDPSFKAEHRFDLEAEVEYFAATRGRLDLQYDSWSTHGSEGVYTSTARRLVLTGSPQWQTNRFLLPEARFENRQNGGSDFRVRKTDAEVYIHRITLRRAVPPSAEGPYSKVSSVSITLGANVISEGLVLGNDPDSIKAPTTVANKPVHSIRPGSSGSSYLYFAVDPSFKLSHPGDCTVEVEYLAPGPYRFHIEYDAENNGKPSAYKQTAGVSRVGQDWETAVFSLPRPRFRNSQNDEMDFRINTGQRGFLIHKVTLRAGLGGI